MALHACWLVVAPFDVDAAFALFVAYYCAVHAPLHCSRAMLRSKRTWLSSMLLLASLASALLAVTNWSEPPVTFVVEEWMQRLVVSHVASDELHRVNVRERCVGLPSKEATK